MHGRHLPMLKVVSVAGQLLNVLFAVQQLVCPPIY